MDGGSLDHLLGTDHLGRDYLSPPALRRARLARHRLCGGVRLGPDRHDASASPPAISAAASTCDQLRDHRAARDAGRAGRARRRRAVRLARSWSCSPCSACCCGTASPWCCAPRPSRSATATTSRRRALIGGLDLAHHARRGTAERRAPLIVVATLEMANAILLEAALSFLGLGVPAADAVLGPDDRRGQELHVLSIPG